MFDDSDDDCMPSTSTAKVAEPVPAIPVDDNSVNSHDRESLGFSSSRDANDVQVQRQIFLTHAPFKKAKLKVR